MGRGRAERARGDWGEGPRRLEGGRARRGGHQRTERRKIRSGGPPRLPSLSRRPARSSPSFHLSLPLAPPTRAEAGPQPAQAWQAWGVPDAGRLNRKTSAPFFCLKWGLAAAGRGPSPQPDPARTHTHARPLPLSHTPPRPRPLPLAPCPVKATSNSPPTPPLPPPAPPSGPPSPPARPPPSSCPAHPSSRAATGPF